MAMSESGSTAAHRDGRRGAGSRIAFGALARSVGEVVAKGASVAFYLVLARELGDARFGDFIFGLSLSQVLLTFAGLGSEELLARNISRDPEEAHRLFFNVSALKGLMLAVFSAVVLVIILIQGYSSDSLVAIMLITGGIAFERQARNYHAVFQGNERNEFVAASLIAGRFFTAGVGVAALLNGAGLVVAAAIFMAGWGSGTSSHGSRCTAGSSGPAVASIPTAGGRSCGRASRSGSSRCCTCC